MLGPAALEGRLATALAELDPARDPAESWQRAWVLAALGRYGEALVLLEGVIEDGDPAIAARGLSTRAAILRQLNLHERALADDESALAVRGAPEEARTGAILGLVSDGVGLDEPPEALVRRLEDARDAVAAAGDVRERLRLLWVTGEVALSIGDQERARDVFGFAVQRAVDRGMRRHEAKSILLLAAANAALGVVNAAETLAVRAKLLAEECQALPVAWPAALILSEVSERRGDDDGARTHRAEASRLLARTMAALPPSISRLARARPPAVWLLPDER